MLHTSRSLIVIEVRHKHRNVDKLLIHVSRWFPQSGAHRPSSKLHGTNHNFGFSCCEGPAKEAVKSAAVIRQSITSVRNLGHQEAEPSCIDPFYDCQELQV